MSLRDFFTPEARARAADAVRHLEASTDAEVVIAVRRRCGSYRHADIAFGVVTMMISLVVILFIELEFALEAIPFEVLAAFAFGVLLSVLLPPLRRLLTTRKEREDLVKTASRACFYDLGMSKTRDRTGLLVFYSVFERKADLVPDIGLDLARLPPGWDAPLHAAAARADLDALLDAVRSLGPALGKLCPKTEDDTNELADEGEAA